MTIRNNDDLRLAYELLADCKSIWPGDHKRVEKLKKQIRSYFRKPCAVTVVRDYGVDGYVILFQLPEFLDNETQEDAIDWFCEECYIRPTCSAYDCTGKPFTNWFKVFRRRGHWFAYHSVLFDV